MAVEIVLLAMPFSFERTDLDGVVKIESEVFKDERGYLLETYDEAVFEENGIETDFVLEFYSKSDKDTLRGLHQQTKPFQQGKIVRCFTGRIFDVAVDVRKDSKNYGEYVSLTLSGRNKRAVYIPRGFAHGFVTLSESAIVHYKVDNEYAPEHECGVAWNDPEIDINWPISQPKLSEKDANWPPLRESVFDDK